MASNRENRFSRHNRRTVEQIQRFLIVSEGMETEPNYFGGFRTYIRPAIRTVGTGKNTLDVVNTAIKIRDKVAKNADKRFDQVWCVFDRDEFPETRFRQAVKLAKSKNIQLAYSNESCELWILLHFTPVTTEIGRTAYLSRLDQYFKAMGFDGYHKNDPRIYAKLLSQQPIALKNAASLTSRYAADFDLLKRDPETKVNELVLALNKQGRARLDD